MHGIMKKSNKADFEGLKTHVSLAELFCRINKKQECIPVGCVLPALVAATRCRYWMGAITPPLEGDPTLERDLPEGRPPRSNIGPGSQTGMTSYTLPLVDRQKLEKTLPSYNFVGGW